MSNDLTNKVAIVTGGANGIGTSIGRYLCQNDATVYLLDIDDKCRQIAESIGAVGIVVDVRSRHDMAAVIRSIVQTHNRLDYMFNNAGICSSIPLLQIDDAIWNDTIAVNTTGTFIGLTEAAKAMIDTNSRGRIINIGSTSGIKGFSLSAHYCASKSAVIILTECAAIELAPHGITVNCISPGIVQTNLQTRIQDDRKQHGYPTFTIDHDASKILLSQSWMQPDDITDIVALLIGASSNHITGQNFIIDGGLLLKGR